MKPAWDAAVAAFKEFIKALANGKLIANGAYPATQPRQKKARWHGYDWDGAWAYALTLRAENQWDWTKHPRDKKQPLPALHRTVEEMIERWFEARGSIPVIEDIRRNIVAPLYAGKHTRPRRKR